MNEKPTLYIIMGPSGAGKSLYGKDFVPDNIKIFDGDKEALRIHKEKGYHLPGAYDAMAELFEQKTIAVLSQKKDFAVESPIGAPSLINKFKNKGYNVKCIFFGVDDFEDSIFRINQRIEGGGNIVTPGDAKRNFEKSKENILKYKDEFKEIQFV